MSYVKRSQVSNKDEVEAVAILAQELAQETLAGVIFFCSSRYDLDKLASELNAAFSCPVIGCTTAGEVADTYQEGGIVGVSFSSDVFSLKPFLISQVSNFEHHRIEAVASEIYRLPTARSKKRVGFLLVDGLSLAEERVAAALSAATSNLSIIGGSAGDELAFKATYVFYDGQFHRDAAVFTLIETDLDVEIIKLQHIVPTDKEVVVTSSDARKRIVYELDGEDAVTNYASQLGLKPEDLSPDVFSSNPVMLQICGEWYVRSIQSANADGSLTFYCAIEDGLPLTISRGEDIVKNLANKVDEIHGEFSSVELTLGCDCILRRLEISKSKNLDVMSSLLRKIKFSGFSTYGEQYNSLHVNQTLTMAVFGAKKHE